MTLHHGDCLDVMAAMEPESVDAIVTDPPYGLEFMGKAWDQFKSTGNFPGGGKVTKNNAEWAAANPDSAGFETMGGTPRYIGGSPAQEFHARWAEAAYRVAKPSAYLLAFGGTRTVHRMTVALEDAGWIIRDMLVWGYASGFPKSKASLKPAWEPIVMARKPGPLRMLAIDECRLPVSPDDPVNGAIWTAGRSTINNPDNTPRNTASAYLSDTNVKTGERIPATTFEKGRWPANIVLTDPIFDGGVEGVVGGGEAGGGYGVRGASSHVYGGGNGFTAATGEPVGYGDTGTYSRFFLIPKADRADREPVLGGLPEQDDDRDGSFGLDAARPHTKPDYQYQRKPRANVHPTVKPTDLMRHLVRLVTPTGGTVLDPFLGSGTTALAAEMEGFAWIGIEREEEYVRIAEARLNGTQRGLGLGDAS